MKHSFVSMSQFRENVSPQFVCSQTTASCNCGLSDYFARTQRWCTDESRIWLILMAMSKKCSTVEWKAGKVRSSTINLKFEAKCAFSVCDLNYNPLQYLLFLNSKKWRVSVPTVQSDMLDKQLACYSCFPEVFLY